MHDAVSSGNVLIPADAVIAQIVRGSGIAQALIEHISQHTGFTHVRIVRRPEGEIVRGVGVVFLRRLASDPLIKAAGAAPDRRQFPVRQRRVTLGGFLKEQVVGLVSVAVALENLACEHRHRPVAAAFLNHGAALGCAVRQIGKAVLFGVVALKALVQRDGAGKEIDLRVVRAEEEACPVQRLRVEVREQRVEPSLHIGIGFHIRGRLNGEQAMESRPCGFLILGLHMMAAEVNRQRHIREVAAHVVRGDPFVLVVGMVIIAVHAEAVARDEIAAAAVAVLILGAYIIVFDRFPQTGSIHDLVPVRI